MLEVRRGSEEDAAFILNNAGVDWWRLGEVTTRAALRITLNGEPLADLGAAAMAAAWGERLKGYF